LESFEFKKEVLEKAKTIKPNSDLSLNEELNKISGHVYGRHDDQRDKLIAKHKDSLNNAEDAASMDPRLEPKLKKIVAELTDKEVQKSVVISILEQLKKYRSFLTDENVEIMLLPA